MTNEKTTRKTKSSHAMLCDCMVAHMQVFGYECNEIDYYFGSTHFTHYDGTQLDFRNIKELMEFVREASHRKTYRR